MRRLASSFLLILGLPFALCAQGPVEQAHQLERKGDPLAARQMLHQAVRNSPQDAQAVLRYAEFLDRYRDPETRPNYEKALALAGDAATRSRITRRLITLDLIEGDRESAARRLREYRAAGGAGLPETLPESKSGAADQPAADIPGPLFSFARMAAVSGDITPADLLPALARNVVTNGYQAAPSGESLEPTEYMKLLTRYVSQARELERLAGETRTIRIEKCESPQTAELLRILGYRMRGGCGAEVVLETVNASRAFLTIDSGFPIAELEQALRTNRAFVHEYKPTRVPVLWGADYWTAGRNKEDAGEFIDVFLGDPAVARLYVAMAKLDSETADALKATVPMARLRAFAHVLDFFGGMFEIRNGKAIVPGGARASAMWAELVGAQPDNGADFIDKLIGKDDGWMASFFDALARINGPVKDYLTEPQRMKRFYMAVRGRVTSPGPARPVFRANTDMMLLTTRLRLDPNGRPHVPGSVEVWKNLFINHPHGKYDGKLTRSAANWKDPDDVLEALFGLCRKAVENEPLKIFMALSDLDRKRAKPLEPATIDRLAREYRALGAQYPIFAETGVLRDETILGFLDAAKGISKIGDMLLRANTAGTMQSLAGLWQIFSRQGTLPQAQADSALAEILSGFPKVRSHRELFDVGRAGVQVLLKATGNADARPQGRMIDLLAGSADATESDSHRQVVQDMIRILEAQRLPSLDTLFDLADNLERVGKGEKLDPRLVTRLASRISEIQLPRANLSSVEKNSFSFGYWTERHVEAERRVNLRSAIQRAGTDPEALANIRGQLAPFLRDTLVGLNYVHLAPPGAQLLLTNPLFVRTHDFLGMQGSSQTWRWTEVLGTGWPSSAGGRLVGSLSGLPYALAEAEQNFMVPSREQALIWGDLAPQMILSAKIPRWWNVAPSQMHWVGLHMRYAESMMAEAALDPKLRPTLVELLERQVPPARVLKVRSMLEQGDVRPALDNVTPAEMFALAQSALERDKESALYPAAEIRRLQRESPERINYAAISRAFGTPKPTLTNSYQPELLHLRTFPTLMGYSSRIMAESWESTILYWAALADEVHVPPSQLNVLIPEWTQKTVEKIFATHLEDWPALLRSLRTVGEDVRLKLRVQMDTDQKASLE